MKDVTIFTTPRSFKSPHIAVIQQNALVSWKRLTHKPKLVLFGDRQYEGDDALTFAALLGFEIKPVLKRSPHGVPLLSDLFPRANEWSGIVCYVNADILLQDDLFPALDALDQKFERFLAVGGRWNVNVFDPIAFNDDWADRLWKTIQEQGSRSAECAIDLFAWKGNVFTDVPDFAIGRYRWDNWLLGNVLNQKLPVIDISPAVRIIHQTHAQVPWEDPDATINFKIQGVFCGLKDSSHTLTENGLVDGWIQTAPLFT